MMNNLRDWDAGCNSGLIEALFHATEDAHMHDLQQELFNIMEAAVYGNASGYAKQELLLFAEKVNAKELEQELEAEIEADRVMQELSLRNPHFEL
tara:strand:+ start:1201 stop:1485 length:285 start_codon:yes stop_codon:yes gene_type:complete